MRNEGLTLSADFPLGAGSADIGKQIAAYTELLGCNSLRLRYEFNQPPGLVPARISATIPDQPEGQAFDPGDQSNGRLAESLTVES